MFEIGEEIKDCKSNYAILRMNKKKKKHIDIHYCKSLKTNVTKTCNNYSKYGSFKKIACDNRQPFRVAYWWTC